jgi:hypothetical protein
LKDLINSLVVNSIILFINQTSCTADLLFLLIVVDPPHGYALFSVLCHPKVVHAILRDEAVGAWTCITIPNAG